MNAPRSLPFLELPTSTFLTFEYSTYICIPMNPSHMRLVDGLLATMDIEDYPQARLTLVLDSFKSANCQIQGSPVVAELHLEMDNRLTKVWNVLGILYGDIEPDRYVILGNHRGCLRWGAEQI